MNTQNVFLCLVVFTITFICFAILQSSIWVYILYVLVAAYVIDSRKNSDKKDGD